MQRKHGRQLPEDQPRLAVVAALLPTLRVTLTTELTQAGQAVQQYTGEISVGWSPDEGPAVDHALLTEMAEVDIDGYLPEVDRSLPPVLRIPVGRGDAFTVDLTAPDWIDGLGAHGQDVALVGAALRGSAGDQAELRATFPHMVHQRVLVLNFIGIEPQWRGGEYGLAVAGMLVTELGRSTDAVALYPMAPGILDLDERDTVSRALAAYWGRLGFCEFNGIMARTPWTHPSA